VLKRLIDDGEINWMIAGSVSPISNVLNELAAKVALYTLSLIGLGQHQGHETGLGKAILRRINSQGVPNLVID
jgi:hypothetical protein